MKYTLTDEQLKELLDKLDDKVYTRLAMKGSPDASAISQSAKACVQSFIKKHAEIT